MVQHNGSVTSAPISSRRSFLVSSAVTGALSLLRVGGLATQAAAESPASHPRSNGDSSIRPFRVAFDKADLADLRRIVALVQPDCQPLLDDAQGLASTGSEPIMRAMRALLRDELVGIYQDLATAVLTEAGFGDRLHKLRGSCGFCGATALAARVVQLQEQFKLGRAIPPAMHERFRATLLETIEALGAGA